MIPVAIHSLLVDMTEVESIRHGILSVYIHRRHPIQCLYLHHIESGTTTVIQIKSHLFPVQSLRHQPAGISQPEKWLPVLMLQVAPFGRHFQFTVFPWQLRIHRRRCGKIQQDASSQFCQVFHFVRFKELSTK